MVKERIRRAIAGLLRISDQLKEDEFISEEDHKEITGKAESIRSKLMEIAGKYEPMEHILRQRRRP